MYPEQRTAFDEVLTKWRGGRMTRRTFLERASAIGLSSVAMTSLLESCSNEHTIELVWQSEFDLSGTYQKLVDDFNRTNRDTIHVTIHSIQSGTNDLTVIERNMFRAHSTAVDIYSVDIVNIPEFASQQWITPIRESQWSAQERAKYLSPPLEACTFNGEIWAAPYRTDVGLIYYRTDLVDAPPSTWDDLTTVSQQVLSKAHPQELKYGYVWQASQYEGLVCNFDEVLHGYGGSILDPKDSTQVTVDSQQARQALTTLVNWTTSISPPNITIYTEEITRQTWESGQAIFMRNWPYAYVNAEQSPMANKFAIHSMLYGGTNTIGHASIGGWQLAINSFIDPEKQAAAWKFIQYMLSQEAQEKGAQNASWLVTLRSIYEDVSIQNKIPLFKEIGPILQTALPRPITPSYEAVSQAIRIRVRQALNGADVPQTLHDLAADLRPLVKSHV
ncbi:MAG TPA: ABC transporter substrate-binding protein [Ktedonobacteraceae bacterium]|jgi:multiple sugar transport system substrate-binding protein|nr:ABC transporter substrate-binding protein [Ktedonobacteraceae bacterium]